MFGPCASERLQAANFKVEFNMLALTKPASIAMAVMLGIALGMPMSIPAFSDPAPSKAVTQVWSGCVQEGR
jgi:hypothetical protein